MKLRIQVPTVTLSVRIAAVDGCSVSDAVAAASAIVSAGVQQVAGRDRRELRRIDAAAVAAPQHDGEERRQPTRSIHPPSSTSALAATRAERRHRLLQLQLQRAALPIAGDEPDGDERQQERRRQLARAERRRPDPDQRRERFADAGGGPLRPLASA